MFILTNFMYLRISKGIRYSNDQEYDDASVDDTNHNTAQTEENSLRLQTISNPYYGGSDYISLHGNNKHEVDGRKNVDTLKIVNNVYYQ